MSEQRTYVPSGRDFIGMGAEIRIKCLFLSYWTKMASLQNCLWGFPKASPLFFGVGGFFGRRTSRCENTGLTQWNLERIYSRSVLWYIFLMDKLILIFDLPRRVWWQLSLSSTPWAVIGFYPLIATIYTFRLACDGSWQPAVELGIVSVMKGIVKSSPSSKLKPIFFPEGGNSMSYVIMVSSLNGVDVISSLHGIRSRRSE